MKTVQLTITGMHCLACEKLLTMDLEDLGGVSSIDIDHTTGQATISFDPDEVTIQEITDIIDAHDAYSVTESTFSG